MAKEPQNFFKHGYRFPSKKIHFATHYGELLMHDSCISFEHLVGDMRPLMELYMLRFVIENPRVLKPDVPLDDLLAAKGFKIDEVAPLSRPEFFKRVFPATSRS